MNLLNQEYGEHTDFSNLTEKNIIYFCRDSLTLSPLKSYSEKIKQSFEKEILEIIQSKDWNWNAKDIDRNIILTYPVLNNAHSIVKYLLDNKKYDVKTYDKDTSDALCSCISIVGEKMLKNIMQYNIHHRYIDDMLDKSYLYASFMSKKEDCDKYLKTAEYLLEFNSSLNNINHSLFTGIICNIVLNNNENKHEYLKATLHHLLENYPLELKKKEFHIKQFFNPVIWKLKKLPQDISSTLESWINYHSLQKELVNNHSVNKKLKI